MFKLFSIVTLFTALFTFVNNSVIKAQQGDYYNDAVQLAARLSLNASTVEISEHLIYSVEDALTAIAQSSFASANAIAYKYNIHTAKVVNTTNIRLIVGKETSWITNLKNTPIHQLFPDFELEVQIVEETDDYIVLNVTSSTSLNMKYVAGEISIIEDIWMVEVPSLARIGNDISIRKIEEGFILTYTLKTSICETGCEDAHHWEFGVTPSGEVSFIGEHGADLTAYNLTKEDYFYSLMEEELKP